MKINILKITLFALIFSACKEKPLEIPASTVGKRKVLVEEATGVNCPNCPDGTADLAGLSQIYGENLVVVAIHGGDRQGFNKKLASSKYDFNTDNAEALVAQIGNISAYPTAAINRQVVNGNQDIYNNRPWKPAIETEAKEDFGLLMRIENSYDKQTRKLTSEVTLLPENTLLGELRITVYIVEDSIVDAQNAYGVIKTDYIHRHIFREILTDIGGSPIGSGLTAGSTFTKEFFYTLPTDFDAKHCEVVAFVHHSGSPDKEVLQVEKKEVAD
jgi:Outer membrane protein Omp28